MNVIIYITMFIIGALLGSFFSLAVYRVPLKKDITHEHSFCPNCNHRLELLDLIPILSYIFLGGKCRYCKQKIRPRYILLEMFSGIIFLLFYISLKIDLIYLDLEIHKLVYLVFGIFYIATLFIIAGIEKEKHYIPNSLLIFGLIIDLIYIIYLYTVAHASIYKYVIYFIFMLIFIIANMLLKKEKNKSYVMQILALCMLLEIGTTQEVVMLSVILSIFLISITKIFNRKKENKNVPIGFYLCATNIILLILSNYVII